MPPAKVLAAVHWHVPHSNEGAGVTLHAMLRALVERGHTVDVVETFPLPDPQRHDGYHIDGVRVHPFTNRDALPQMLTRSDVLVTHLDNVDRSIEISRRMGKPCFVMNHNSQLWSGEPDIYNVYNSQWLRDRLQAIKPTPYHLVVRPPVCSADYKATPGNQVTLINLNADKGAHIFYELARRMPDVAFLGVVGAHGDQIIHQAPNVEIMEHTEPQLMKNAYGKTRILLMPSVYESWGRTGVEAIASGIPVIATPTTGLMESLGYAGTFVSRDDLDGWQRAINDLMDVDTWQKASRQALIRSKELDQICKEDLNAWCEAVENACRC